jgi:tight adherence protein B
MEIFGVTLSPAMTTVAVALLAALSIGGVLYALLEPLISGTRKSKERLGQITARELYAADRRPVRDADRRRKSVQDQLKEFDEKQKARQKRANSLSLQTRMEQAGLNWERKHFVYCSVGCATVLLIAGLLITRGSILVSLAMCFVGAFGLPRFFLNWRRKRRFNAFIDELPNAVDIIVRGVRAGLPLADCIRIVAAEARDPVATEFRRIVETQVMGVSLTDAVARLPERIPLPEANFFAIVVSIQQQSGGGLSEALGNLAKVLRGRKTLKGKIRALSSEAKSSAAIIGSLPIIVALILYSVAPKYIMTLFTETAGHYILAGSAVWMLIGVMVMRKMINFDF